MYYFFHADGRLNARGRRLAWFLVGFAGLAICLLCFLPQQVYPHYKSFSTPGIVQLGRLYFLPIPFNSLVNAHRVDSLTDFGLILLQNLTNIALLYPLVLPLVFLLEKWQSLRAAMRYSFALSLFIELTQLLLDLLLDAGRVFEIDDLWSNTLGGVLAYLTYKAWLTWVTRKNDKKV